MKTEEAIFEKFSKVADQIKLIQKKRLSLVGAPVLPSAVDELLQSKLTSLCRLLNRLEQLDTHEAFFFRKNCFAIPKLSYVLRGFAFFRSLILEHYELKIQDALEKILNAS